MMKSEHNNKWEKEFEPFEFTFYSTNIYWELLFASVVLNDEGACPSVLSREWFFAILWTIAHQASQSWDFLGKNTGLCDAISSSRGSSWPRDRTHISCLADGFFTTQSPGKPSISVNDEGTVVKKTEAFALIEHFREMFNNNYTSN